MKLDEFDVDLPPDELSKLNSPDTFRKGLNADDDCMIVYHFGLYECDSRKASRNTGERSPRVYFLLGANGFIYILFFDPYHELNP